jgi:hypothetical protein
MHWQAVRRNMAEQSAMHISVSVAWTEPARGSSRRTTAVAREASLQIPDGTTLGEFRTRADLPLPCRRADPVRAQQDADGAGGAEDAGGEDNPPGADASDGTVREDRAVGVWGKRKPASYVLREHDRVEFYQPLLVDPKQQRRQRHDASRRNPPDASVN